MEKEPEKKISPIAKILADKKANAFKTNQTSKSPKPTKGFGGGAVVRRAGRGR